MRILKSTPLLSLVNSYAVDSPQPANLSYAWNFGSLLGIVLVMQIITGVFLAMHYTPSVDLAFVSVEHIMRDVNYGWLLRYLHANGASAFFIFVYAHIGRGLYYGSYKSPRTLPWSIGVIMLVLIMGIAFLGYVLPYGQMSLWGIFLCPTYVIILINIISFFDFITIYLEYNRIAKRIPALSRIGPHNYDILSIICGTLLGDAHTEFRPAGNGTRIGFYQEAHHSEYLLWLHNLVAQLGYCNPVVPKIQTRLSTNGVLRYIIRFHTYTYTSLNTLYHEWYINGVKHVPQNIAEYLTPLALALWIMDDGARIQYGLKLCTNSFTFADCTRLVEVLHNLYGIKSSVQSAGVENQYVIHIWSEAMPVVRELVRPYMVSSMLYKLGE